MIDLDKIATEQRNSASRSIDTVSTEEMLRIINAADKTVAAAVEAIIPHIAVVIDEVTERIRQGGRLLYIGAGTSGRLGMLDAAECPPTYNTPPRLVRAVIAGGKTALSHAKEGAEDSPENGADDLKKEAVTATDTVIGLSASGRTPYVAGALEYAKKAGAYTVAVTCSPGSHLAAIGDIDLCAVTGPEVVTGSTRMKAGTAQKMILNMISTGVMIRLGKVYGNLMVDVRATNAKLKERARRIVMAAAACTRAEADAALDACNGNAKPAIIMLLLHVDAAAAAQSLEKADGYIDRAIKDGTYEL